MNVNASSGRNHLRRVSRQAVRAEIAAEAMSLFIEQGFEQTTVEQVAAAVGMSPRSVFRYFDSKEDMVVGDMTEIGSVLAETLAGRPTEEGPWEALRHTLTALCMELSVNAPEGLARAKMFEATPSLQAARQRKQVLWRGLLVPGVRSRLGGPAETQELRATALISAALACLNIAIQAWSESEGTADIAAVLDTALGAIESATDTRM